MSQYSVRFTEEAQADLERLYDHILERDDTDWALAERARAAVRNALQLLEYSPFSCRKAAPDTAFLRELIIGFVHTGYVVLFEIDGPDGVTVLAVRHQREDDYR